MFWRKRPREQEEVYHLVQINDRVQLEVSGSKYISRVEDVLRDEIHVAPPVTKDGEEYVRAGQRIGVDLLTDAGIKKFSAKVNGRSSGNVPLLRLCDFKSTGTVQRRKYVRLSERLPMRYRWETPGGRAPWRQATTNDVSAGGLQMIATDAGKIIVGDILEVELTLPGEETIRPLASVVRVVPVGRDPHGPCSIGLCFVRIHPSEQDQISRYVFRRQSELRDARRKFARLKLNRPFRVQYRAEETGGSPWRHGNVHDVSLGGLRILANDASGLGSGQKIELCAELPGEGEFSAVCEIIRVLRDESGSGTSYQISVRFVHMSEGSKAALQQFLFRLEAGCNAGSAKAA